MRTAAFHHPQHFAGTFVLLCPVQKCEGFPSGRPDGGTWLHTDPCHCEWLNRSDLGVSINGFIKGEILSQVMTFRRDR